MCLKNRKLSYAPGVELNHKTYSNTAYSVLGHFIEAITNQQFDSYIRENILEPVGMEHSGYSPDKINEKQLSQPHVRNNFTRKK
jgi:CubicO group peptidase (beta-lactamase class C family)